jgi:hypothetical protein
VKVQEEEEMPSLKLKVYPDMPFYEKGCSKGMYCKKIKNKNVRVQIQMVQLLALIESHALGVNKCWLVIDFFHDCKKI